MLSFCKMVFIIGCVEYTRPRGSLSLSLPPSVSISVLLVFIITFVVGYLCNIYLPQIVFLHQPLCSQVSPGSFLIVFFLFLIFIYLHVYFAALGLSCGMQDLHCCLWDL